MILIILLLKYIASMLVDVLSIPLHFNRWIVEQEWGRPMECPHVLLLKLHGCG